MKPMKYWAIPRNGKNTILKVNPGNMPMSLRLSRKPMVHEAVRLGKMAVIGIRPTVHTFRVASAEMKADSETFSRNFSESGGLLPDSDAASTGVRIFRPNCR